MNKERVMYKERLVNILSILKRIEVLEEETDDVLGKLFTLEDEVLIKLVDCTETEFRLVLHLLDFSWEENPLIKNQELKSLYLKSIVDRISKCDKNWQLDLIDDFALDRNLIKAYEYLGLPIDFIEKTFNNILLAPTKEIANTIKEFNLSKIYSLAEDNVDFDKEIELILRANKLFLKCDSQEKLDAIKTIFDDFMYYFGVLNDKKYNGFINKTCYKILGLTKSIQIQNIVAYLKSSSFHKYLNISLIENKNTFDSGFNNEIIETIQQEDVCIDIFSSDFMFEILCMKNDEHQQFLDTLNGLEYSWQFYNLNELLNDEYTLSAVEERKISHDNWLTLMYYATIYKRFNKEQQTMPDNKTESQRIIQQYINVINKTLYALGFDDELGEKNLIKKIDS